MRIEPLGESVFILRDFEEEPYKLARMIELNELPGVEEVVSSVHTVGVYVNPAEFDPDSLKELKSFPPSPGTVHRIPIVFNGLDFLDICNELGKEPEELPALFCESVFTVGSIGFLPGFPYLHGLPEIFHRFERRAIPRIHVPKGSIGIAAGQAGIYPKESPGGWQLIATTPLTICDPGKSYFPISPGDEVRFVAFSADEAYEWEGATLCQYAEN